MAFTDRTWLSIDIYSVWSRVNEKKHLKYLSPEKCNCIKSRKPEGSPEISFWGKKAEMFRH